MPDPQADAALEQQIDHWRGYLRRRQAIHAVDVAELEDHLREQIDGLVEAKQSVNENMAPVLTRLFIPLFAALLLVVAFPPLFGYR